MQRVFQLPRLLIKKATVSGRRFRKETMRSVNYEEKHSHQALSYHLFVISTRTFSHSDHRRLAVYVFTNRSLLSPASPPQSGTDAGPYSPGRSGAGWKTPAASPARHDQGRDNPQLRMQQHQVNRIRVYPGRRTESVPGVLNVPTCKKLVPQ